MKLKTIHLTAGILALFLLFSCQETNDPKNTPLANHEDSLSYVIGADYADVLKANGYTINEAAFYKGFYQTLNGTAEFPDSLKVALISEIRMESQIRQQEEMQAQLQRNKEEGARFMAGNRERPGIVELPEGLQYRVLKQGSGPKPGAADSVLIHYRSMFIDGTVFDESYQRGPQGINLSKVTRGLSLGLQQMQKGSIYELFIPSELGFGDQGIPNAIAGGETLIYTVELIEIY